MSEEKTWNDIISTLLLANKEFSIKEVNDFEEIHNRIFDKTIYKTVVELINKRDWEGIRSLPAGNKNGFREYLDIFKFTDQNKLHYAVTIYDSDELYQDPEIIEIIPLT